jgi:chromosome segregation ATPase
MMEEKQLEKRLTWLDDQRRKDAEVIRQLTERLAQAEEQSTKHTKLIQDLSGEIARNASLVARVSQFDDALSKQREEVSRQLDLSSSRQSEREKYLDQKRRSDRDDLMKKITEIQAGMSQINELFDSLEMRKHEEIRLSHGLDKIENSIKDFEEKDGDFERAIKSVEDSRNLDARRVADIQTESTELRVKIDALRGLQDAAEDRTRRLESRLGEFAQSENERRESQTLWEEKHELRFSGFERDWKDWEERFEEFSRKSESVDERMVQYDETHRAMRQTRNELSSAHERLERRITEISEMQRLAEDRIKQEWTIFLANDQKRWNTYKLTYDEQWREHNRSHDKLPSEIESFKTSIDELRQEIEEDRRSYQERVSDLLVLIREWAIDTEPKVSEIR